MKYSMNETETLVIVAGVILIVSFRQSWIDIDPWFSVNDLDPRLNEEYSCKVRPSHCSDPLPFETVYPMLR